MYEHCFWTIKAEFITKLTVYLCSVAPHWSSLPASPALGCGSSVWCLHLPLLGWRHSCDSVVWPWVFSTHGGLQMAGVSWFFLLCLWLSLFSLSGTAYKCALLQMQQLETSMSACFIPHPTSFLFLSVPFFCLFLFFLLSFANMAFSSCLLQHNIHTDNIKIINKYNKNINKRSLQRVHSASLGKANVFCTTKQSDHDSSNYKCFIWQVFKKDNVLIWISFITNTTNNYKSFNKHKYTYISPVFSYFTNVWFF